MMENVPTKKQKTKEYRERIQQCKIILIPKRNDVSLFQKVNCVEGLAIPIFQIIQEYCNENDYRSLMNTNLSTFQPIKWETVKYSLIGPMKWDKMSPYKIGQREERLFNIINNNVKDKSKQISITFCNVKRPTLTKYSHLFQGIYKLHFTGGELSRAFHSFSLDIFQDLKCLTLKTYYGDTCLNVDWKHLVKLELVGCNFSVIESLNSTQTLKELIIKHPYDSVKILCPLDGIERIECVSFYYNFEMEFPKNCANFELKCESVRFHDKEDATMVIKQKRNQSYDRLAISCSFLHFDSRLLEHWSLYSVVEMTSPRMDDLFPSFPFPRGEKISLTSFSLSSWNGRTLFDLKELHLDSIENLDILPEMPRVESVSLENVSSFRIICGLPCVKKLIVKRCESLERIDFCPKLEDLDLYDCPNLSDVSSNSHVKTLQLSTTRSLTSLNGFEGNENSFINDRRKLVVSKLWNLSDFSFCRCIYDLFLHNLPGLVSCKGINNVHNLGITDCRSLTSTQGLRNISGKLYIHHCSVLLSLLDVQNIPEIEICVCPKLTDFSGLGHNEILKIRCKEAAESFEKYQEENRIILVTTQKLIKTQNE
jgi:hypothetical protein